jgi:hypothetical protein
LAGTGVLFPWREADLSHLRLASKELYRYAPVALMACTRTAFLVIIIIIIIIRLNCTVLQYLNTLHVRRIVSLFPKLGTISFSFVCGLCSVLVINILLSIVQSRLLDSIYLEL